MSQLVFTPLAEADLGAILDYIAQDRPLTAVAVIARIREKCELLASQPLIGQQRPEFPGDYRSFPVDRWVIFYRVQRKAVEIQRIIDGARDLDSLIG
jgi:toxin ParE1/3/4